MSQVNLIVEAGGMGYRSWTRASVQYSAKQAVRAFALTVTDAAEPWKEQWSFMPGEEVSLRESGEIICKGYIDRMSPSFDANNHHVEISGRSKSGDTVDSSAEHDTGEFRDKTILDIAKALDKQDVRFTSKEKNLPKVPLFRLNPFETVFAAVERIARKQHLLLIGNADGSIEICKGGDKRVNAPLIQGHNILSASAVFDGSERHNEYKVRGQKTFGSNKSALNIEAKAKDKGVKRNRPKHIHQEADMDDEDAERRAENHRDRQQGESISASVRVQGWRDEEGELYVPNTLIYISSPFLKLDMDLLIESVNCTKDQSGSFTSLTLVQPKALGSKASTGSKTDEVWS